MKIRVVALVAVVLLGVVTAALSQQSHPEIVLQYSHAGGFLLSFSRSGLLATGGYDGKFDIWDTRNWTLLRTIRTHEPVARDEHVTSDIALSPDGKILAHLTYQSGKVELWDTKSGKLLSTLSEPVEVPHSLIWSDDGKMIAACGKNTKLWTVKTGKLLSTFPTGGDITFSSDGKTIGIYPGFQRVLLYSTATGKKIRELKDKSGAFGPIAISPDGKLVATGGENPEWDPGPYPTEDGRIIAPSEAFYAHELKVKIWSAKTGKLLRILPGHQMLENGTRFLQFAPDSRTLFSGGSVYSALWDVRTGKKLRSFPNDHATALSPDGKMVAVTNEPMAGQSISVFDVKTGKRIGVFDAGDSTVSAVCFSPDGKLIAAGDEAGWVRLWDVRDNRLIMSMISLTKPGGKDLSSDWLVYLPDGTYHASNGAKKLIRRVGGTITKEK